MRLFKKSLQFQPFSRFLSPSHFRRLYPRHRAYHFTISYPPFRAYPSLQKRYFDQIRPYIPGVFRHIAQKHFLLSILVYWYTSISLSHFSTLKRFRPSFKKSDVRPIFSFGRKMKAALCEAPSQRDGPRDFNYRFSMVTYSCL